MLGVAARQFNVAIWQAAASVDYEDPIQTTPTSATLIMFSYRRRHTQKTIDPDLWAVMQQHPRRERRIELIASENCNSPAEIIAQGSQLTIKYAEGYPHRRYQGGCEYVDVAERLARRRNAFSSVLGALFKRCYSAAETRKHRSGSMEVLMTKLRLTIGSLLTLFLMALIAGPAQAQSTLKVVPLNELKILDPIWTTAYATRDHGYLVYDTLLGTDENFAPKPQMADSWTVSGDQLTWTFVLREGLKWSNGTPVTADDCVASLRRWAVRDTQGQDLAKVWKNLIAKDSKTIVIELNQPFPMMLQALAKQTAIPTFMMPRRIAETDPFQPIKDPIGSGPFVFKQDEWVLGSKAVYVKNPYYVPRKEAPSGTAGGKIAKVDRIELVSLPDTGTAMNALQAGEVDYWLNPPADMLKLLEGNARIKLQIKDPAGLLAFLRLNHLAAPTNNKKLRQAILAAVDQKQIMLATVGDPRYFKVCNSLYPCGSPWSTEAGNAIAKNHSIAEAKALLKSAGYKQEKVVILQAVDSDLNNTLALMVADSLKRAGINVELQPMDYQTLVGRRGKKDPIGNGGWSMFATNGIAIDYFDPFSVLLSGAGEKGWPGWVNDPQIEALKRQFAAEGDTAKRKEIADKIQVLAYDTVAYVPLGMVNLPVAFRDTVSGIVPSALNLYWNISVKKGH
jgi:peptide/nickel transport system substrate-binding protein